MTIPMPALATDCHVHLFGPANRYPFAPDRVYTPSDADEAALLAMHRRAGIERVVLVQPSPYGTDNSRLLHGLKQLGNSSRGIAVIDPAADDSALDTLHAAGVRGVRVNIATHGMHDPAVALTQLEANARRVAHLGWHVQVLTSPGVIATLGDRLSELATPLVIDHFGLADMTLAPDQPGFSTLLQLVKSGRVFVKLSAIERRTGVGRRGDALPFILALVEANHDALLWGSDWPHTGGGRDKNRSATAVEPFTDIDDGKALEALAKAISGAGIFQRILVDTPARLYDFQPESTS